MSEEVGAGDQLGAAVHTELAEQVLDVRRHGLLADRQLRRDLFLSTALDEKVENLDLPPRELKARGISGREVARDRLAVDEPPYPGDQLVGVERLDDKVVSAEEQARDPVERLGAEAGEEEDRQLVAALASELATDLVAGHVGQADLEHDERNAVRAHSVERGGAGAHFDRLESGPVERSGRKSPSALVAVSNDNYAHPAIHRSPPPFPLVSSYSKSRICSRPHDLFRCRPSVHGLRLGAWPPGSTPLDFG
jgi:hypothetical protein